MIVLLKVKVIGKMDLKDTYRAEDILSDEKLIKDLLDGKLDNSSKYSSDEVKLALKIYNL